MPALVTLELIDEQGQPTETFQKIRTIPEADYKATLAAWLRSVYADIFSFVDPANDEQVRVRDAFRSYVPHGQQDRMVALFLALCAEAGIVSETKKSEPRTAARKQPSAPRAAARTPRERAGTPTNRKNESGAFNDGSLPPALVGIIQSIPSADLGWTQSTRDKFITTFSAVLDFVVPIKTDDEIAAQAVEQEEHTK